MGEMLSKGAAIGFKEYVTSGAIAVEFDDGAKKIIRSTGSFLTDGFTAGMVVYTSSATNPGPFVISVAAALELTLETAPDDEGSPSPATTTIYGDLPVGKTTGIEPPAPERKSVDLSHHASSVANKKAGLLDGGEVGIEMLYDPSDAGQKRLKSLLSSNTSDEYRITYPDGSYTTFSALVLKYGIKIGGDDDPVSASATLAVTTEPATNEAS